MSDITKILQMLEAKINEQNAKLYASQSQLKVYREALEEIEKLDSTKWHAEDLRGNKAEEIYHMKTIARAALSGDYDYLGDIGYQELVSGWRAALSTNPSLEAETK